MRPYGMKITRVPCYDSTIPTHKEARARLKTASAKEANFEIAANDDAFHDERYCPSCLAERDPYEPDQLEKYVLNYEYIDIPDFDW